MTDVQHAPPTALADEAWREQAARIRALRGVEELRSLPTADLAALADQLQPVTFDQGQYVATVGTPVAYLHLLDVGRFTGGRSHVGAEALQGRPHSADVIAEAPTAGWRLAASQLPARSGNLLAGVRVDVEGITARTKSGAHILHEVSFTALPGQLVAIVGGSGAGKTTLLDTVAGVRPVQHGAVLNDGTDRSADPEALRGQSGYVPQDDIIHKTLSVRRTLTHAARLRLPSGTRTAQITAAVEETMAALDLGPHAQTRIAALSGGQRKRVSIAVELLTKPRLFFLDEPTSGLDPATGLELMRLLRRLADLGATIILTTHAAQDLATCDRVVFLAPGGHLAFTGSPQEACGYFGSPTVEDIYDRLAHDGTGQQWGQRFRAHPRGSAEDPLAVVRPDLQPARRLGPIRQWNVLTRRDADILAHNRLTLAILLGSPLMIVGMFAVLFKPGAFNPAHPSPSSSVMVLFWVAFGAFFFGLTYGLLQIAPEMHIVRRERIVGLRLGSFTAAKTTLLLPVLIAVDILMLAVLRVLDRLPAAGWTVYAQLGLTMVLASAAALALGLFVSAAVGDPSQATIALPMLCFPQVLFAGAMLPVPIMASAGKVISYAMSTRWTFEAMGKSLGINRIWGHGDSPLGPPLLRQYGATFTHPLAADWVILAGFTAAFLLATHLVLVAKCRPATHR